MKLRPLILFLPLLFRLTASLAQDGNNQTTQDTTSQPAQDITPQTPQDIAQRNYVAAKVEKVKNKTVDYLDPSSVQNLPLGIARKVGGQTFVIAIDSGRLTPQSAFVSAYAMVPIPGVSDELAFAGQNIAINPGGVGGNAVSRISLVSTHDIKISSGITLHLSPKDPNYVEFDCNGFKDINLSGEFVFSRDMLIPDSSSGTSLQNVVATFRVNATDFTNLLFAVNITPFRLPALQDISFEIKNAVVDLSDFTNPQGVVFPSDYQTAYRDDINLWHGFYIQQLNIKLPNYLKDAAGKPITIYGNNMLIDSKGFTGIAGVKNLLPITNSGNDWPFSIDNLSLSFSMGHLTGGAMSGVVSLPFVSNDTLGYQAMVAEKNNNLDFSFLVSLDENKNYDMPFGGTLKLLKGSSLDLIRKDNKLAGLANLSGNMYFNQSELKSSDKGGLGFTNFQLSTESPYILSGNFDANVNLSSSNFPISISNIFLGISKGKIKIGLSVGLNLMNSDDKSPTVTTTLAAVVKLKTTTTGTGAAAITKQDWKFDGIEVDEVDINNLKIAVLTLSGKLKFFHDDPTYGNGFNGQITLGIEDILPGGVHANVYFGSMPDFRYWHVDVKVPVGYIPIIGPLMMDGIIGGASYQMVKATPWQADFSQLNKPGTDTLTANNMMSTIDKYVPDSTAGISFLAGLTLVVANEKLMNGDAVLEIAFRKGGGLKYIEFTGGAYILAGLGSRSRQEETASDGPQTTVPIYAYVDMKFDNDNKSFHAQMTSYVNAYGIIEGVGPQGKVGDIVLHFDPKEWYVYIGRPSAMLGLKVLGIATIQSYFMIGSVIDPFPPLPPEVQSIAGDINLDFMQHENALATGGGIGFGAHLKVSVGAPGRNPDGSFKSGAPLPIYAQFDCGLGADIMFRQYDNAFCKGSSSPIGIGGWYASGQAYAYLAGSVGVCWKHCRKKINFLDLAAAAVLQAKLPNPSWFRGLLAGHYSVLCGLIKGHFSFQFTIGDECDIVGPGSELGDIAVISDMKPDDGSGAVSVFASPQVTFNIALNKEIQMVNDADQLNSYRVEADEIKVLNGAAEVPCVPVWNSDNTNVVLTSKEVLPSKANLVFSVKLHWEKKVGGNWQPLMDRGGGADIEVKQVKFTTDMAPGYIPDENVAYTYPVKQQYNFYSNEYNKGYVKLIRGQSYLFHASDSGHANQFTVNFAAKDLSNSLSAAVAYDSINQQVNFDIPAGLNKEVIYDLSVLKIIQPAVSGDANVQKLATTTQSDANNDATVTTNSISGTQTRGGQTQLYQSVFRTSKYNSFADKVHDFQAPTDLFNIAIGNVYVLLKRNDAAETFDGFEIYGKDNTFPPLVQPEASNTAAWLSNYINPVLYDKYNGSGLSISWRDPNVLGMGPTRGIQVTNDLAPDRYYLEQNDIDNGFAQTKSGRVYLGYYLSYYVFRDYHELRNEVANMYLNTSNMTEGARRVFEWPGYVDLVSGNYPLTLKYVLPGTGVTTSSVNLSIKF